MTRDNTQLSAITSIPDSKPTLKLLAPCLLLLLLQLPAFADHIHHVWYNNSNWQDEDLTALTGGPTLDSVFGIAAFYTTPNHQLHVYYAGNPYPWHVHQLYYKGNNWVDDDLTALTGGPGIFPDAISGFAIGNLQYVFYMGLDNHIHELNYNNVNWTDTDLTAVAGGPEAAGDYVVAFPTKPNNQFHVYYDDSNAADLHQLYFDGTSWVDDDLTTYTGARCLGAVETSGYATGNLQHLFCQGQAPLANPFDMLHIYYNNSTWVYEDISALTAGDISMLPGAGQAAFAVAGKKELFGITNDYDVQQYELSRGKWNRTDLTNAIGAPINEYPGEMVGFITTPNDQFHVYYAPSTNGSVPYTDLYQLYYNGSAWAVDDLTSFTGAAQADALGGIAGFAIGNLQHVFYEAQGN
jgi:hypothetical protein